MIAPAARGPAPHADHVALARHALADLEAAAHWAPSSAISPEYSWPTVIGVGIGLLRPLVPVEDVHVGAADAGLVHFHQHVVGADLGDRLILEPQARLRLFLDEGAHGLSEGAWPTLGVGRFNG